MFSISSRETFTQLFNYKMEPDADTAVEPTDQSVLPPSPVRSIHFVAELRRVCVAMHNGRMFLCDADVVPSGPVGGEGESCFKRHFPDTKPRADDIQKNTRPTFHDCPLWLMSMKCLRCPRGTFDPLIVSRLKGQTLCSTSI